MYSAEALQVALGISFVQRNSGVSVRPFSERQVFMFCFRTDFQDPLIAESTFWAFWKSALQVELGAKHKNDLKPIWKVKGAIQACRHNDRANDINQAALGDRNIARVASRAEAKRTS